MKLYTKSARHAEALILGKGLPIKAAPHGAGVLHSTPLAVQVRQLSRGVTLQAKCFHFPCAEDVFVVQLMESCLLNPVAFFYE